MEGKKDINLRILVRKAAFSILLVLSFLYEGFAFTNIPSPKQTIKVHSLIDDSGNLNETLRKLYNLDSKYSWKILSVETDEKNNTHSRYQQYFDNLKVENTVVIVHSDKSSHTSISGTIARINTNASLNRITSHYLKSTFENKTLTYGTSTFKCGRMMNQPELVWYFESTSEKYVQTYKMEIASGCELESFTILADATDGNLISVHHNSCHADVTGIAVTAYHGIQEIQTSSKQNYFILEAGSRGNGIQTFNLNSQLNYNSVSDFTDTDTLWNPAVFSQDKYALDAHYCATAYYDYLNTSFSRNSIDNNGQKLVSYLNYGNGLVNAFWNGSAVVYGSGNSTRTPLTTLDISGHEFTHGLIQKTANLNYSDEPGTINEAISDIFGTALEHFTDTVHPNWNLGDKTGFTLRSMSNPMDFDQPDTYHGTHWYFGTGDNGGIHINSGFINKWFYLLSQGGQGTNNNGLNYTVNGTGIQDATKIVYHTLLAYLVPTSGFDDFRDATLKSASDIFGNCSPQVLAVADAWKAVGFGDGRTQQVTISSTSNTEFCDGENIILSANGWQGSAFTWFHNAVEILSQGGNQIEVSESGIWTVVENRCGVLVSSDTLITQVHNLPVVSTSNAVGCFGDAIQLTGFPIGGLFSVTVPYIGSSTNFEYRYTDANGCTGIASGHINVSSLPDVQITLLSHSFPQNHQPVLLTGNQPGVFSGHGVSGNYFNPSLLEAGNSYKVYLSYTNNQGCTNRDSMVMTITEPCIKNTENIFIQPEAEQVLKNVPVYFSINALENEFGYEWELPLGCKAFTGVNASRIGLIFSEPESEIAVKITNTCGDTFCKKMVVRLAEQSNILFDVHFYPVPAKDFLTIQLTGIEESTETIFKISDCNGKQIYILKTDHLFENIDLRGLASGLYSLEVQHGTSFKRHRFIKL